MTYSTLWKCTHQWNWTMSNVETPIRLRDRSMLDSTTSRVFVPLLPTHQSLSGLTSLHVDGMVMLDQSFMAQDWILFLSYLSKKTSKWFCKKHRQLRIGSKGLKLGNQEEKKGIDTMARRRCITPKSMLKTERMPYHNEGQILWSQGQDLHPDTPSRTCHKFLQRAHLQHR